MVPSTNVAKEHDSQGTGFFFFTVDVLWILQFKAADFQGGECFYVIVPAMAGLV